MEVPATQAWVGVTWDRPFNASRSRWTNPKNSFKGVSDGII